MATTLQVDLLSESFDNFPHLLQDGADATEAAGTFTYNGNTPIALKVVVAEGPGGWNPVCQVTFQTEKEARAWLAEVYDDPSEELFIESLVG